MHISAVTSVTTLCIAVAVLILVPSNVDAVAVSTGVHTYLRPQRLVPAKATKLASIQVAVRSRKGLAARRRERLRESTQHDHCHGKRFTWMSYIEEKCRDRFGSTSAWDQSLGKRFGKVTDCQHSFKNCLTARHRQCCTKPVGIKNLNDYCILEESKQKAGQMDSACLLNQQTQPLEKVRKQILALLDAATDPSVSKLQPLRRIPPPQEVPPQNAGPNITVGRSAAAPAAAVAAAPAAVRAAANATAAGTPSAENATAAASPAAALVALAANAAGAPSAENATAAAPAIAVAPAAAPAASPATDITDGVVARVGAPAHSNAATSGTGQAPPSMDMASVCSHLESTVGGFKAGLARIHYDHDQAFDEENTKQYMKDPQLVKEAENVVQAGQAFAQLGALCVRKYDDYDKDEIAVSDADDGKDGTSDGDDDNVTDTGSSSSDDADDEPVMVVNQTAVELLNTLMGSMDTALVRVDTNIHPYNLRWWRYRWEYSVVESVFVIPGTVVIMCVIVLWRYFEKWYMSHSKSHYALAGHRDGDRFRLVHMLDSPRQVLVFILEFSTAIVALVGLAWNFQVACIYGHNDEVETASSVGAVVEYASHAVVGHCVYDWLHVGVAQCNAWLTAGLRLSHLPIVGESYHQQLLDVAFHLLGMYCIYTLLIIKVVLCWRRFLEDLTEKARNAASAQEHRDAHVERRLINLFRAMGPVLQPVRNLEDEEAATATRLMKGLCPDVQEVHRRTQPGATMVTEDVVVLGALKQFPYACYIEIAHIESQMVLTSVNLYSLIVLIGFSLTGGLFCFTTQLCFFWFLPVIVALSAVMFAFADWYSRRLLNESGREIRDFEVKHDSGVWLNLVKFSRIVQCVLLIVCYSFSRLLLSPYFWVDYFEWSCVILIAFLLTFYCVYHRCAKVMSNCIQALVLPPYVDLKLVTRLLEKTKEDLGLRAENDPTVQSLRKSNVMSERVLGAALGGGRRA